MTHHRKVMGDKHISKIHALLKIHQKIQDLRLNRNIQRRNRLVTDHKLRIQDQSPGDADSLAAAAVQLVGISHIETPGKTHGLHHLIDLLINLGSIFADLIDQQRLRNQLPDRHTAVQARIGVLEDHLDLWPNLLHFPLGKSRNIFSLKKDLPGCGRFQAEKRPSQRGFSAAGLSHHAHRLSLRDTEIHIVHRMEKSRRCVEIFFQVSDLKKLLFHHRTFLSSPPNRWQRI